SSSTQAASFIDSATEIIFMAEPTPDFFFSHTLRATRVRLRASILGGLYATALCAGPVWSADATARQAVSGYQIAPGELAPALLNFAGQAGVNLSIDMDTTRGLKTRGLTGSYSVQDGFGRLLAGTHLRIAKVGEGNYTLEAV